MPQVMPQVMPTLDQSDVIMHTVRPGETIGSILRNYRVCDSDPCDDSVILTVLSYNRDLQLPLLPNDVLVFPASMVHQASWWIPFLGLAAGIAFLQILTRD